MPGVPLLGSQALAALANPILGNRCGGSRLNLLKALMAPGPPRNARPASAPRVSLGRHLCRGHSVPSACRRTDVAWSIAALVARVSRSGLSSMKS